MRVRLGVIVSLASVLALVNPAGPASSQASSLASKQAQSAAKSFLQAAYRHYENHGKGIDFTGPQARQFFHSSLISLIETDEKAVAPEVGVLDGDPICSCQDWDGIWDLKIAIEMRGSDRANASVSFALFKDGTDRDRRSLEITLATENGAWRIYNVLDKTDPRAPFDLRAAVNEEIESLAREQKHKPARRTAPKM